MNVDVEKMVKTCQICQENLPLPVNKEKKQGSVALYPMEMVINNRQVFWFYMD